MILSASAFRLPSLCPILALCATPLAPALRRAHASHSCSMEGSQVSVAGRSGGSAMPAPASVVRLLPMTRQDGRSSGQRGRGGTQVQVWKHRTGAVLCLL